MAAQQPHSPQGQLGEQTQLFEQARLQLARLDASNGSSLRELWLQLAQVAADALQVDRVGVWVAVDQGRALRCRYLLQHSNAEVFQGAVLRAQDFPEYFDALYQHRTVPAGDVRTSEPTQGLCESYLQPLGITSMLDAPIYIEGRVVGVVCHEHIGPPRNWSAAEADFASAVADNISRLYQEHERAHAQTTLRGYEQHLMELHRMEAVGRVAADIAHDFRSILGAAMGYAELIRRVPGLPADAARYSQRIIEALQRGSNLTQEVLSFGKNTPIAPRVIDVRTTVEALGSMLGMLLGNRIRLDFDFGRPVSRIFVDASQLERTLLNLALNARDAMPDGGTLTIGAADLDVQQDGERATFACIEVADTGIGMDAATREHVFKPFFTTKGEHGTGLGLAIVDQIITRAGGFIRIESEPGQGTKVRLYLPRIAAANADDRQTAA